MSDRCITCARWLVRQETVYSDGTTIVRWRASSGHGKCRFLNIETPAEFGCAKFEQARHSSEAKVFFEVQVETERKDGAPWQHFTMIECPACSGRPGLGEAGRCKCAGTGKTRLYDDGYVGDEHTRKHPKELERPPIAVEPGTILQALPEKAPAALWNEIPQ